MECSLLDCFFCCAEGDPAAANGGDTTRNNGYTPIGDEAGGVSFEDIDNEGWGNEGNRGFNSAFTRDHQGNGRGRDSSWWWCPLGILQLLRFLGLSDHCGCCGVPPGELERREAEEEERRAREAHPSMDIAGISSETYTHCHSPSLTAHTHTHTVIHTVIHTLCHSLSHTHTVTHCHALTYIHTVTYAHRYCHIYIHI
jgi:hypothetical protein